MQSARSVEGLGVLRASGRQLALYPWKCTRAGYLPGFAGIERNPVAGRGPADGVDDQSRDAQARKPESLQQKESTETVR